MDESNQKVIDQIEKLLRVAARTNSEAEATSFTNKANALLATHNLTLAEVETASSSGVSGRRLDEHVSGGMYKYQRRLWHNIAQLNFCMYWTMPIRVVEGSKKAKRGRVLTYTHRLVGRQVNVIVTRNMAGYLNGVIERMCRERLQDRTEYIVKGNNQFYSREAIAYREGIADRVVEKIRERRATILEEEALAAEKAARAAARKGVSTERALTLASVVEREKIANYDFLNGEGAWARKEAEKGARDKEWAKHRAEEAKAEAEAEAAYAAWAKANPEEAAREERQRLNRERAAARRRARRGGGWGRSSYRVSKEDQRRDSGEYYAGYDAGDKVSIDQQVDTGSRKRIRYG